MSDEDLTVAEEVAADYEFPVSAAQQRLLVLDRMTPGTAQYSMYVAYSVRGVFDAGSFERCVAALVDRHEALRTVFRVLDGEFVQVVRGETTTVVKHLTGGPDDVEELLRQAVAQPFDLAEGPLFQVVVINAGTAGVRIALVAHHLVADGWSLGILVDELSRAYAGHQLPDPGLQYADYTVWQRDRDAAGQYDADVAFWRDTLKDAPPLLPLPSDLPRPRLRTPAGGNELFELPADLVAGLDRVARECSATPTAALLAAFAVFLSRLSGRSEVVMGTPVAGRDRPELHQLVGMLVNTVALRLDVAQGRPAFRDLVRAAQARLLQAAAHSGAPFDLVVDALAPRRALDHDPVYQVVFAMEDVAELTLRLPGAEVRRLDLFLDMAKFDFMATGERDGDRLAVRFVYRSELYSAATITLWGRLFRTLLAELLAGDGARPVVAADWLDPQRRRELMALATGPTAALSDGLLAHELFERTARRLPTARAVVSGNGALTYQEADEQASRIAGALRARGIGPGALVALCLPRGSALPVAVLGVLKSGAGYVPLDPEYPAARLKFLLADSGAATVLVDARTREVAHGRAVLDLAEALAGPALPPGSSGAGDRDLAYVIHTSGSTGRPKGVAVEHRSLVDYAQTVAPVLGVAEGGRVLTVGAFTFDVTVSDMFLAWSVGAELHVAGADERLGARLAARLREAGITAALLLPSMIASIPDDPASLPALRTLAAGAEPLPAEVVRRWAPGRRFVNVFGPTETTIAATTADMTAGQTPVIGRPLPNTRVLVLDDRLRPAPVGVGGEIYVAGPGLARGYVGRPGLTAERFVADPFGAPGGRLYRTGDLGRYLDSGALDILGRVDDQVKVRGYRIEPGEIEAALLGHPAVRRAAVLARDDDGGADPRLVAYFQSVSGQPVPEGTLRRWLAERLPSYLVPAAFVQLAELPATASGKVDKAALPAPTRLRPELGTAYGAPATYLEHRLAAVWAEVLDLNRAGVHDNFFDLGGNSVRLLAVQTRLAAGADGSAPLSVDLVDMFRYPTVSALAAHLEPATGDPDPAAVRPDPVAIRAADRGSGRRQRIDALTRRRITGTTRKA